MKSYPLTYNPILEYWEDIETGKVLVSNKVRRIYSHIVKKLNGEVETEFEYDPERANHVIEFVENFTCHSKGKLGGTKVVLERWQKAFIATVFGFIHKIDGTRQYRELFLVVARKNGKSLISSALALYLQIADGEPGAEIYACSTKRDSAKIVWLEAKRMVQKSPALSKRLKPLVAEIRGDFNDSFFKPLGSDSETLDGLNVHGATLDKILSPSLVTVK